MNDEYTADRDRRTGRAKDGRGPERRRISPDAGGQLLEQSDRPAGSAGFTAQMNRTDVGALGTDDREGREPDETDPRRAGNGDEGGAATPGEKASGAREAERERRSSGTDRRKNRPLED